MLAGGLLGYLINLIATFTAPSIGSTFGKLKSGLIERNKSKALTSYAEVYALRSGKRDKYLYAINHWGYISLLIYTSATAAVVGVVTGRVFGQPTHDHTFMFSFLLVVLALVILFILLRIANRSLHLMLTLYRVENFEEYRTELLQRWPDLVLPE